MMLSIRLWAIIIPQMCFNWSYYTLLTSLPTYMDNILHFDLKSVSVGSAPFLQFELDLRLRKKLQCPTTAVCPSRTVSCRRCRTSAPV